jgi:sugar-specific transcriptional regulator TrmB
MRENLEATLQSLGLNSKEAKIYLALLELNEGHPSTISRKSGIKRPTTYVILEQLTKHGLVSHVKKSSGVLYRAVDPRKLIEEEKNKINALEDSLPELMSLGAKFGATPQMSVYEGQKGLIQIMEETLNTSEHLLCWCDVEIATGTILSDYFPYYLKKKVQKGIWLKGIFTYNQSGLRHKKNQNEEFREVYLVPKEKFPFKNEINIYDDKVAIISHQDEIGVIIQNQNIADSQKAIFNLAFEYAKILEKEVLTKKDKEYLKTEEVDQAP